MVGQVATKINIVLTHNSIELKGRYWLKTAVLLRAIWCNDSSYKPPATIQGYSTYHLAIRIREVARSSQALSSPTPFDLLHHKLGIAAPSPAAEM
ncbi:hypothetical protein J6590_062532 [Homalodisca vitripennis]|nr:hypothetical protein J6590_062532 [Homalodisca vitripennis]